MTTNNNLKRDRVAFDRRDPPIQGDAGDIPGEWREQFQESAAVTWLQGGEPIIAQRLQGVNPVTIVVAASSRTRQIDPSWRCRLTHLSEKPLSILSVVPDVRGRDLRILCQSGGAVG